MEQNDLLIAGGCVVTMDAQRRIIREGAIAVSNGEITAVGKADQFAREGVRAKRHIDATGKLVIPGLIDSHNHPIHFLSKGIADDMPVQQRWRERVWPYEAQLTAEETKVSATGTFMEMIQNGTTCFNDPGSFHPDAVAQAAIEVGIRGVISRVAWDVRDSTAPGYDDCTEEAFSKGEATVERWHGAASGRIRAAFSLVRSAHVTDSLCRVMKRRADELGVTLHGHLCTTRQEVELSKQNTGLTPLERYRRLELLGSNLILVHMGWVEPREVSTLAEHDVSVCHCPSASMFGGFGCIAHG
jgi:5-methylthioadenosine/S-adenosylhomocysteine deaminase